MRIGIQVHISPGLVQAAERAKELGCECLQIFARNPRGWRTGKLDREAATEFRRRLERYSISPLFIHASYLVNLASPSQRIFRQSLQAVSGDFERAELLGAEFVVVHTGYHRGIGRKRGIARVVEAVDSVLGDSDSDVGLLLENTAGAGTELGGNWEELAEILERVANPQRVGICLDTCHAHVAGYDLSSTQGVSEAIDQVRRIIGLERVALIHANDAKAQAGSRRDLHQHIGKGTIGKAGFRALLHHPDLQHLPVILETPIKSEGDDERNLKAIRRLASGPATTGRDHRDRGHMSPKKVSRA